MDINKPYDLEERVFVFAKDCRKLMVKLTKSVSNIEDGKQLIRSSGSIGANYLEANEKVGEKDFIFRLKIARKEAKESIFWLNLLKEMNEEHNEEIQILAEEANQLRKILSSILIKYK